MGLSKNCTVEFNTKHDFFNEWKFLRLDVKEESLYNFFSVNLFEDQNIIWK